MLAEKEIKRIADLDRRELRFLIFYMGGALNSGVENNESSAKTIVERIRTVLKEDSERRSKAKKDRTAMRPKK